MIKYFNKYGEELRYKEFIELQWNRKYNECGSFVLYMAARDYDPEIKYIKNVGRPEMGIVQKIQTEKKAEGDFVTLSGFFIEKLADNGMWPFGLGINLPNAGETAVKNAILAGLKEILSTRTHTPYNGIYNLYDFTINANSVLPSSLVANIEKATSGGKGLYDLMSIDARSYYCQPIMNPNKTTESTLPLIGLDFVFWQGRDLRDTVFFGAAFNNIKKINYTLDDSNVFTYYEIYQEVPEEYTGGGFYWCDGKNMKCESETYIYEGNRPGDVGKMIPVKTFFSNVSNVELTDANRNKIRAQMKQQAKLDMLNHYRVENISADVIQNRFLYRQDYDLGDVCSIVIDEIQQMYTARIVEVYEVHSANKVEVQIVLGTPQKQKYRRVII